MYNIGKYGNLSQFGMIGEFFDGTLLHVYCFHEWPFLVEVLLKDGFDCNIKNKSKKQLTPLKISQEYNQDSILKTMERMGVNTSNKLNDSTDDEKQLMDDKSFEIRYNSFMNQYMSTLYLLKKVGLKNVNQIDELELEKTLKHKALQHNGDKSFYKTPLLRTFILMTFIANGMIYQD